MTGFDNRIIAEVASAHNGSVDDLISIVRNSINSDFDAVKIQIYCVEELLTREKIQSSRLLQNQLSYEDWRSFSIWWYEFKQSSAHTVDLIIEPFGHQALDLALDVFPSISQFKLPTSDFFDRVFLERLLNHSSLLYLGVGGSILTEIASTLEFIKSISHDCKINLIHGFQGFPTEYVDAQLWKINYLKNIFGCDVGYACHSDAHDPSPQILCSAVAIGAGASFIEKHVNLDRSKHLSDHMSSLDPSEYTDFVSFARLAFTMQDNANSNHSIGDTWIGSNEVKYRESMKKYACASKSLQKGHILTDSDIVFKRTSNGVYSHLDSASLLGKCLLEDITFDSAFELFHINS